MSKLIQVWFRDGRREIAEEERGDFDDSLLHRVDGPAMIYPNGTECWYQNGQLHRTDGPAVIYQNGLEYWYQNGLRHRVDGPAQIYPNGSEWWYLNGQLHRVDGPAVIYSDDTEFWFLNDLELPKDEVELWIKTNCIDLNRLEDQLMFLIKWGSG